MGRTISLTLYAVTSVVGRFAPSPTGYLHLGSARTALVAWLSARAQSGRFLLRIEDLDPPRVIGDAQATMIEDLRWLGLDWDEGPDVGGGHGSYVQSQRSEIYRAALATLLEAKQIYACTCSRKEIAAIASAPHGPDDEGPRYPGTCRSAPSHPGRPAAWRFQMPFQTPAFEDAVCGMVKMVDDLGDFVVARADGIFAYHLAVVVDDAAMGVTEVVRGADLLSSTPRHIALQNALGYATPRYAHLPLMMTAGGERLAKRHGSSALAELRANGTTAESVIGKLAHSIGLTATDEPVKAAELIAGFHWSAIAKSI